MSDRLLVVPGPRASLRPRRVRPRLLVPSREPTMARPIRRSPRPGADQARRAVLWGLLLFVGVQAVLGLAIAQGRLAVPDPLYVHKFDRLRSHAAFFPTTAGEPRPTTVLMLGSSRTMMGLDARRLGEELSAMGSPTVAFNFGIAASGPMTQALYLRRMLAEGMRPDHLLIEVLPPFFAGQHGYPMEADWLVADRLRPDEYDRVAGFGLRLEPSPMHGPVAWIAPATTHRFPLLNDLAPWLLPANLRIDAHPFTDDHGWCEAPMRTVTDFQRRKGTENAHKQYGRYLDGFRTGGAGCRALNDLLALCREEGISTTLVLMPEGSDFRGWYPADGWHEFEEFLRDCGERHGCGLINAREWLADSAFTDSHHLLPEGAAAFTDRLAGELRIRLAARKGPA